MPSAAPDCVFCLSKSAAACYPQRMKNTAQHCRGPGIAICQSPIANRKLQSVCAFLFSLSFLALGCDFRTAPKTSNPPKETSKTLSNDPPTTPRKTPGAGPVETTEPKTPREPVAPAQADPPPEPELPKTEFVVEELAKPADAKRVHVGPNVWLEVAGNKRRVLIGAVVCLGTFKLEQLLCRSMTKEHEAILTSELDARDVHKALLLAGAQPGSTVKYEPAYTPPKGTPVKITVYYKDQDKKVRTISAKEWIRNVVTKKALEEDWVFAGSLFVRDNLEPDKPERYLANDGSVICIANSETALLDLPINSPNADDRLLFNLNKEKIPPIQSKVVLVLEPILGAGAK